MNESQEALSRIFHEAVRCFAEVKGAKNEYRRLTQRVRRRIKRLSAKFKELDNRLEAYDYGRAKRR